MSTSATYPLPSLVRIGIINALLTIGLLRLTNLNYYLSQLIGLETEINNTGGNAFNFNNYLGVGILAIILLSKGSSVRTHWSSTWPFALLMIIYVSNFFLAPYANLTWIIYQEVFLLIALLLHIYVQKIEPTFYLRFASGMRYLFWSSIGLVAFSATVLMLKNNFTYYIEEFNEVFVQTLDDYGIMKQRYGYLMGFLVAYILFFIRRKWVQILLFSLILTTSFGIRSFVIGIVAAGLITLSKGSLKRLGLFATLLFLLMIPFQEMFRELIYDTRFYSYLNAWDIIGKYPFGVGLGGYEAYTEQNSRMLFASFYDINAILDYIPLAPESDIVHIFGTLGPVLGTVHFLIIGRIIWLGFRSQRSFCSFEKCILFYFTFMTFFGVGEDSIFSINYWIVFGLASGILAKRFQKDNT